MSQISQHLSSSRRRPGIDRMITDLDVIDVTPDGFPPREVTPPVTVNDLAAATVTAGRRQRRDVLRPPGGCVTPRPIASGQDDAPPLSEGCRHPMT